MPGQVYAVASGKGGVGKTTTAVNLGVSLRADGHSVLLVDADLGMPNLADFLGIDADGTIHDVLAGNAVVEDVITDIAEGFAVIPGDRALEGFAHADPNALDRVVETAAAAYDYVIVDTGAGLSYEDVLPLGLVDEVILVTTPDPAAVGDTAKTVELAGLVDGAIAGVVVTRVRDGDDPDAIADRLGVDLLAAIPFEVAVQESTASGSPLEAHAPTSASASAYRGLEATLTNGEPPATDPTGQAPDTATTPGAVTEPGDDTAAPSAGGGDDPDEDPSETVGDAADAPSRDTDGSIDDATDQETASDDTGRDETSEDDAAGAGDAEPETDDPEDSAAPDAADDGDTAEDGPVDEPDDEGVDSPDEDASAEGTDRTGPLARFLSWFR